VALWAALLLFLGSRTPQQLPDAPLLDLPGADKLAHALAYGGLGYLLARARGPGSAGRALMTGLVAGLAWGLLDETVQAFAPGRHADGLDLAADALGAAGGAWLRFRTARRPLRS